MAGIALRSGRSDAIAGGLRRESHVRPGQAGRHRGRAREILGAVEDHLLPAAARFRPDLVLISAGFDSRIGDLLGSFTLTDEDFADLTRAIMGINDGRVISVLEGGYNLEGLASAAVAHTTALLDG